MKPRKPTPAEAMAAYKASGGKGQTPETNLKNAIKDALTAYGWRHYPIMAGMGSYPGMPDRIAIKRGKVLMIEAKTPKGVQSENQKKFQAEWEGSGGTYMLVRDIDKFLEYLGGDRR